VISIVKHAKGTHIFLHIVMTSLYYVTRRNAIYKLLSGSLVTITHLSFTVTFICNTFDFLCCNSQDNTYMTNI